MKESLPNDPKILKKLLRDTISQLEGVQRKLFHTELEYYQEKCKRLELELKQTPNLTFINPDNPV